MDKGDYFLKNGKMDQNLGLDYLKTNSWSLDPVKKGTVPKDSSYVSKGQTFDSEFFSIDGEKYPSQRIQATVI